MPETPHPRRAYPPGATLKMQPMRDGWPIRVFDWPAEGEARGSVLFQGGRADIIEKYLEAFRHWHDRGWRVTAFDWRGQGGSGRLHADPMVGHGPGFRIWIDDLAEFCGDWEASGPRVVIGHSMGGHLILRALSEKRISPDGVVLVAPMLGFETKPLPLSWVAALVGALARGRLATRPAWKSNERPALPGASRQRFLTSDLSRYDDETWWKREKQELALGPPTLGWLAEAYGSSLWLQSKAPLDEIDVPITIIGTDGDKLVSPDAIRHVAARMPHALLHMFGDDVAHEILRERDGPRDEALALIDALLDRVAA